MEPIEQATLAFLQDRSAAEIQQAIALMRAYCAGREIAERPEKRRGRPNGSRNKPKAITPQFKEGGGVE